MDKIDILSKDIEQRIVQLENDKMIDDSKREILIRENNRFLERCKQLFLSDDSEVIEPINCKHISYRAGHSPFVPCICNDCGEEL